MEILEAREVVLGTRGTATGAMRVSRTLPNKERRMVGAWCFVDQYGPDDITGQPGMRVAPHPHTGLQTVTWLVQGEVLHTDSVGSTQTIEPGQLNLMTAGRGIAHAEQSPPDHSAVLEGVQLWVALPERDRDTEPHFASHPVLPRWSTAGARATVLVGAVDGASSQAEAYTPLMGASVEVSGPARLPLDRAFEYAVLRLTGTVTVDGFRVPSGPLIYLGRGHTEVSLDGLGSLLLLGGEPFEERIVMWWNFVGRSHDEVVAFRDAWQAGALTGPVHGYLDGGPIPAPPLPTTRLVPRGRLRSDSLD